MKQKIAIFMGAIALTTLAMSNLAHAQEAIATKKKTQQAMLDYGDLVKILRPEIAKIPSVRGIIYHIEDPKLLKIITSTEMDVHLDNFKQSMNRNGVNRATETKKFVGLIQKSIAKSDPFKRENLRIIIRSTAALDDFEKQTSYPEVPNHIIRRSFVGNLEEVIVAETETSIAIMSKNRLPDLQLDEDLAFKTARLQFSQNLANAKWENKDGLLYGKIDGAFDASLLAISEIWQSIEDQNGFNVAVAVPNRGTLAIGDANDVKDIAKLKEIAKAGFNGSFALTDNILVWKKDHWEVLQ